jgi:hypothetical protein
LTKYFLLNLNLGQEIVFNVINNITPLIA